MKAHIASLLNALVLIGMSAWGYLSYEDPSITVLIPAFIGVALLAMNPGIRKENKIIAHVAVLVTLLILGALVMPLNGAIKRADDMALMRVAIMMASTVFAMIFFVKSFIDARKRREQGA